MKKTSTILIILMTAFIFSCKEFSKTDYSTSDTKVYLMLTPNTTASELRKIAVEFKQKRNIDVDFLQSDFNGNGKIKNLVLKVNTNDGFSGEARISSAGLKMKSFGFIRDYAKDAKQKFSIGTL